MSLATSGELRSPRRRAELSGKRESCKNGHPWTPENVFTNSHGREECRTCKRDLQRAARKRRKAAAREDPEQNRPAYLSDELGLSEADKAGVEHLARTEIKDERGRVIGHLGVTPLDELLRCVERRRRLTFGGERDGIIETAWALPLWQYRKVEEAIAGDRTSSQRS